MANGNWCVLEQGDGYMDWSRVGLWCPTRRDANAELRRLQRIFPALNFTVGQIETRWSIPAFAATARKQARSKSSTPPSATPRSAHKRTARA